MPVRFTCRFLVVRTASGKLKVQYGYLGDDCELPLVVRGPRMLPPPEAEMTDEEFDRWQFALVSSGGGFSIVSQSVSADAPLVECTRTYEDVIPKGSVKAELSWVQLDPTGMHTLGVRVTNGWGADVPKFSLSVDYLNDAPQPHQAGAVLAHEVGGADASFFSLGPGPFTRPASATLHPGAAAAFGLGPEVMRSLRSRAASMSTDAYWIALRTAGHEFDRVPGPVVGAFLDTEPTPPASPR